MSTYDDDLSSRRPRSPQPRWDDDDYAGSSRNRDREDDRRGYDRDSGYDRDPGYDRGAEASTGRSSVGRATVGRASVTGAPASPAPRYPGGQDEPEYGKPYGDQEYGKPYGDQEYGKPYAEPEYGKPYGEAEYGAPYGTSDRVDAHGPTYEPYGQGRDPYAGPMGDPPPSSPAGPATGRASVGRATVPTSPGVPGPMGGGMGPGGMGPAGMGPAGMGPAGMGPGGRGPGGPGGRGPGGPGGPGGRGPGGPFGPDGPDGPDGYGDDDDFDGPEGLDGRPRRPRRPGASKDSKAARSKKARRRNIIISAFAVVIMLTGVGVVGGTYYVNGVVKPDEFSFPESTTLYYSDGKTVLARLGETLRYELKYNQLTDAAKQAVVASEDNTFWTNEGIDFKGVMRAAWNNFTGGAQQGASTITQQYARLSFDLGQQSSYARKLNEAVLAWRLDDELSKEQILEYYLNTVPFGRNTYGIEAAAQTYFGKTADKSKPVAQQLTKAEAMALILMVKQPNPEEGAPGYDPTTGEEAKALAIGRWNYVRSQMVALSYITQAEADAMTYPTTFKPKAAVNSVGFGQTAPAGLVINHVMDELSHGEKSAFKGKSWKWIEEGGFKIVTTLNLKAQQVAQRTADETVKGSVMYGQKKNLQAALVAVQPGTGAVLAYYGGHNGAGTDYAGIYRDSEGDYAGFGAHSPGSSFKVYTLAAALSAGYSLKSWWDWSEHDMIGRTGTKKIRNASSCTVEPRQPKTVPCTLLNATTNSLNVPFYALTLSVTPAKVIEMARNAGIDFMWTDDKKRVDLRQVQDMGEVTPSKFDTIVGIGQYAVTVLDHANALATLAADGLRAEAHFVRSVSKGEQVLYSETMPGDNQQRIMIQPAINDLNYALSTIPGAKSLANQTGWSLAGKTGTWEYNGRSDQNAHCWMVGYSKKMAVAVWVGNKKDEQALIRKNGGSMWGYQEPGEMWTRFMKDATAAMALKKDGASFAPPAYVGDENPAGSTPSPIAPPPPTNPFPGPTGPTGPTGTGGPGGSGNPKPTKPPGG